MSESTRMVEGKAAVCDLCNGIGYLGENECPRCNTAVGGSSTPVEDSIIGPELFASAVEAHQRQAVAWLKERLVAQHEGQIEELARVVAEAQTRAYAAGLRDGFDQGMRAALTGEPPEVVLTERAIRTES